MYKCKHCSYTSRREFDLRRHENRKTPCFSGKINASISIGVINGRAPISQNGVDVSQHTSSTFDCSKCKKALSSKWSLERHTKVCKQVQSNVCPICHKVFSSRDVRNKHMKHVKCSPPPPPGSSSNASVICTINNTTNNNTIDNSQNINITLNFGQEALERLCTHPDYLKRMEEVVRLGKYALPQHISDIYFNDLFPMNNTIMKTRHNDRFVRIKTGDNEWNLRAMDDLYNTLTECMKGYMTSYFLHAEKQLEKIYDEDRVKFKRLTKSIREFGHKVLWLDWNCNDIRQIETQQNDPYCENERSRRIQEMKMLLLDHIYDKMKRKLYLQ